LEILGLLGRGGIGVVYKARQPRLNRIVALKILSPELSRDPAFAARFSREAQSLARLNHSNIVGIFDFGQTDDFYYFLMEYVEGLDLHTLIHSKTIGPVEARRIAIEICHGLQFAHEEGVIHRDIKPSNILIDQRGRVKIADFGLAKLIGTSSEAEAGEAPSTMVMGTAHYMAPEQIETPNAVDHRADLYALGVVFYEMLTGELPLGRFDPPSRKSLAGDVQLDQVVLCALQKNPNRRYQDAAKFCTAVETATAWLDTASGTLPAPPETPCNWRYLRQFALTACMAALAVFFYFKGHWATPQSDSVAQVRPAARSASAPQVEPPARAASAPQALSEPQAEPADPTSSAQNDRPLLRKSVILALQLAEPQVPEINRTIRLYQHEFVLLEHSHASRTRDKAGHIHVTITPFPDEMDGLMARMWTDLAGVMSPVQLTLAPSAHFEKFFPNNGRSVVHLEIWKDRNGEEHFVESENPPSDGPKPKPGVTPQRFRFYLRDNQRG
jgi:serine/threonine protein kinase